MKIEKFNDRLIAFDFESEMVNATDMLKAYPEKRINNFLRTQQTKDFIKVLEQKLNTPNSVIKSEAGKYGGTWMQRRLALKFAAWLSPEVENFVYEIFEKVLLDRLNDQQRQLDYFWDKEDNNDIYRRK